MERSRSVKKSGCSVSSIGKRSNARADASAAVRKQLINAKRRKNQESDATMLVSFYSPAKSLVVVTQTESASQNVTAAHLHFLLRKWRRLSLAARQELARQMGRWHCGSCVWRWAATTRK